MRRLLALLLTLAAAPAHGQVTLDLKALDQPASPAPAAKPRPPRPVAPRLVPAPGSRVTVPESLPTQTPPVVRLAPDVVSPAPAAPPAPPPVAAESATTTAALPSGLRVLFADGKSDLSPASDADIAALAAAAPKSDSVVYDVRAYASGPKEDPSTSRRLSLARALAVRGSLMARGIPSARVYVRALGSATTPETADAPPDRADVTVAAAPGAGAK